MQVNQLLSLFFIVMVQVVIMAEWFVLNMPIANLTSPRGNLHCDVCTQGKNVNKNGSRKPLIGPEEKTYKISCYSPFKYKNVGQLLGECMLVVEVNHHISWSSWFSGNPSEPVQWLVGWLVWIHFFLLKQFN